MIRRTMPALPALLLGLAFVAEPYLAAADTKPKKPPQKPAPQVQQPSPPTKSSKYRSKKYQSLDAYHPHAKGSKTKRPHNS